MIVLIPRQQESDWEQKHILEASDGENRDPSGAGETSRGSAGGGLQQVPHPSDPLSTQERPQQPCKPKEEGGTGTSEGCDPLTSFSKEQDLDWVHISSGPPPHPLCAPLV